MQASNTLERLVSLLSRFPGIGAKTAQRLAWHLISEEKSFALSLAETITQAANAFGPCSKCNMLSESDPCYICSNEDRQKGLICIVENSADVLIIEKMNVFDGFYFVLGHLLSPIDGIGPNEIKAKELLEKVKEQEPWEIIMALKPSAEGEATMHYLSELLKDSVPKLTRLSIGLPFGGDLEYSSNNTLRNAWARRYSI